MLDTLYLVEKENEYGSFEEPQLLTIDGLVELAEEYDEDIDEDVVIDALTSTFGYILTEINKLEDMFVIFNILKENYMNF